MTNEQLNRFAADWIGAWNSHNLDTIMEHYSDDIEFYSPLIQQVGVNAEGRITNKPDLRNYFSIGLQKYPDLKFELYHTLKGVHSLVLFYKSINNKYASEYMELNNQGKITVVKAHYTL